MKSPPLERAVRAAARLRRDVRGNVGLVFAIAVPSLLAMVGSAVDYANFQREKAQLQGVADAAALAAAKELHLGNSTGNLATQVAQNYVNARSLGQPINFSDSVANDLSAITVTLNMTMPTYVMQFFSASSATLNASATARVVGGQPICVIGLDSGANFTIGMDKSAQLQANGCSVYSNSTKPDGLFAKNSATLTAAFICSAGGKAGAGPGSFSPTPLTGCPAMPDPLASRPPPTFSGCDYTNYVVSGGSTTIFPGTYCGGVTIEGGATVQMAAGVYVLQSGPFYVTGGATVQGTYVGLYFTGSGAVLNLDTLSNVTLSAPSSGAMAGILVYEDRSSPAGQTHQIISDNARTLLGTIYIPQGTLYVAANNPVADQSAYTIIVARRFQLSAGPTLVLNTNYSATDVPTPDNVGPNATSAMLSQ